MTKTRTRLIDTSRRRCERLLSTTRLGRVAAIVVGRPEISPVNHVYDTATGTLAFPAHPGPKLHGALDWPWLADEVDGMDERGGRSVTFVGRKRRSPMPRRSRNWRMLGTSCGELANWRVGAGSFRRMITGGTISGETN